MPISDQNTLSDNTLQPRSGSGRQALRQAGYKLTTPRLAVLNALEHHGGHLTAAELTALIEQEAASPTAIASIGRATIFRTLDLLVQIGIVSKTMQGGSVATYVLMTGGHHHHLICTRCQRVIEFPDCGLSPLLSLLEAQFGFHVDSHLLEVYGICQACRIINSETVLAPEVDDASVPFLTPESEFDSLL